MKNTLKYLKLFKYPLVFILIFAWAFLGWPPLLDDTEFSSVVREAQAFHSRVQLVTGVNNVTATVSASWASTTTAGNLLIAAISFTGGSTVAISSPSGGWTLAKRQDNNSGTPDVGAAIYYIENASSQSGSSSWGFDENSGATLTLIEYAGAASSSALDKTSSATVNGDEFVDTGTTATLTQEPQIAIAILAQNQNANFSNPNNGFSELADITNTGSEFSSAAIEEKLVDSTSGLSVSANSTDEGYGAGVIATFKLVATGGG